MKSLYRDGIAGNVKMRGKLTKELRCRCCAVMNFKWRLRVQEAKKEIREHA